MSNTSGYFALRLAPQDLTLLAGAEGGDIFADVQSVLAQGYDFPEKQLGPPKYSDFSVQLGWATSSSLFDWIATSWTAQAPSKDGALLGLSFDHDIVAERTFAGALIAETTIPTLDASAKSAGYLTVKFTPESVQLKKGSGKAPLGQLVGQRLWRTRNFRVQIDGLDCQHVSRVESFTVKRALPAVHSSSGGTDIVPGPIDFPNLKLTLGTLAAPSWFSWHDDFVVQGHNGESFEKNGSISFLAPNLKTVVSTIVLHHLGIVSLVQHAGPVAQTTQLTAELYCEQMELIKGGLGP